MQSFLGACYSSTSMTKTASQLPACQHCTRDMPQNLGVLALASIFGNNNTALLAAQAQTTESSLMLPHTVPLQSLSKSCWLCLQKMTASDYILPLLQLSFWPNSLPTLLEYCKSPSWLNLPTFSLFCIQWPK